MTRHNNEKQKTGNLFLFIMDRVMYGQSNCPVPVWKVLDRLSPNPDPEME